jgi:hypothetical protein
MFFDELADADGVLIELFGNCLGVHPMASVLLEDEQNLNFQLLIGDGSPAFRVSGFDLAR